MGASVSERASTNEADVECDVVVVGAGGAGLRAAMGANFHLNIVEHCTLDMLAPRLAVPLLASSVLLFYGGAAFAYFVVFPLMFQFFTTIAPEGVAVTTDISSYLDFVLALFLAFGVAFELPIAIVLMVAFRMFLGLFYQPDEIYTIYPL